MARPQRFVIAGASLAGAIVVAFDRRQMLALTQIFHEPRGQVAGHLSFRSRRCSKDRSRIG